MKPRHKRLLFVVVGLAGLAVTASLVLYALKGNLQLFFSPSELAAAELTDGQVFRLGGLVQEGSVRREDDGLTVHFVVTDNAETMDVTFVGILPDLFKEGQGVVAQGKVGPGGVFLADEVLAKHDETYMPPEVAAALEKTKQARGSAAPVTVNEGGNN